MKAITLKVDFRVFEQIEKVFERRGVELEVVRDCEGLVASWQARRQDLILLPAARELGQALRALRQIRSDPLGAEAYILVWGAPDARAALLAGASDVISGELDAATFEERLIVAEVRQSELERHRAARFEVESQAPQVASAARSGEEKFGLMVEAAPTGLLMVDETGRIVLASTHAEEMFGFEPNEMHGMSVDRLVPDRYRPSHPLSRDRFHANPSRRLMGAGRELWATRKDGTEFPVEIGLGPLWTENGFTVVCNVVDITERKRLEKDILQSQKTESIGRLAGGLAHDFNNLLSVVLTNCGLLLGKPGLPPECVSDVAEIQLASERAASLTGQLLAIGRKQVLSPRVLDLNEVLSSIEGMLRRVIGENIELTFVKDPELGSVRADPVQLVQVIVNLAINARDAMPSGGRLVLETDSVDVDYEYVRLHPGAVEGPHVRLCVTDTGTGMDEEVQKRLFEPFFTTKEVGRGTGLGLSTALGIIKQSGGHMIVYSELGHGTVFRIYLPVVAEKPDELAKVETTPRQYRGTGTILIAEDSDMVRESARRILSAQGYNVLLAAGGAEALEIARKHEGKIDLLLSDVVMPGMNGQELASQMANERPDTQALLMSGHAIGVALPKELVESQDKFLQKPFTIGSLSRKVWNLLNPGVTPIGEGSTVLVLENEEDFRAGVCEFLHDIGIRTVEAGTLDEALARLRATPCDLVLSDVRLPGSRGKNPVAVIGAEFPKLPVMLMSGMAPPDEGPAPAAFLQKPFDKAALLAAIRDCLARQQS